MPLETPAVVVRELTSRGYNAEREAVTLLARAPDPGAAVAMIADEAPDDALTITASLVRSVLGEDVAGKGVASQATNGQTDSSGDGPESGDSPGETKGVESTGGSDAGLSASNTGTDATGRGATAAVAAEQSSAEQSSAEQSSTEQSAGGSVASGVDEGSVEQTDAPGSPTSRRSFDTSAQRVEITNDITGQSTGTGEYDDFVSVFRDRYQRLSKQLRGRVNHRPTDTLEQMAGGSEAAIVGMVNDIRSTKSGHWLIELEDTNGTFPALIMKDRDIADHVNHLLLDEVIAVEGSLSGDGGILFVDSLHFPDIPRTFKPNTADRHVQAALISDVHVGSQEFMADAWSSFANWLHTEEADAVEYLCIAGDMVEGVGIYPNQDEELDIIDIYDQYEQFAEYLKEVPGDMEIIMIPGNHDAVRLAEPQPAFDENLRDIMQVHDARFTGNPSTVSLEGVNILMYHGVSLDEVIAEFSDPDVSYDNPHIAMQHLLRKRHVAPQYGGRNRIAPEEKDYLVIDDVPDVFHTGHVHKLGIGGYHNVRLVNSGCWQSQTDFQKSVNIDPDTATAPILDLDTLDVTVRKFA